MATATAKPNGRAPRVPLIAPAPEPFAALRPGAATPDLDAAVFRIQAKAAKLIRNATGQIQSRTYTYVTLTALTDDVHPLLAEEGLLWRTFPTTVEGGHPGLRYRMTHIETGQYDEDVMALPCDPTMQALGSGITYGRRYTLMAYLNLTIDEDDDGLSANAPAPRDRYAEAEAAHAASHGQSSAEPGTAQPSAKPAKPTERRITANQRTKLLIPRAKQAKLTDGEFANVILMAAGDPPRTWSSPEHEAETLKRLLDHLPARLKDAVLEGIDAAGKAKAARAKS